MCEGIKAAGASVAYLPPYSPDLNPIEQVFAKLKALLRKYRERTLEALWKRLDSLIELVTLDECRNFIQHCGYRLN